MAVTGTDRVAGGAERRWPRRLVVVVPVLASVALVGVAFTSAPLELTVDSVSVAGVATVDGGQHFRSVEVTVQNQSDTALTPHFMVTSGGGHPNAFWQATVVHGADPVQAGAVHRLHAPAHDLDLDPTPRAGLAGGGVHDVARRVVYVVPAVLAAGEGGPLTRRVGPCARRTASMAATPMRKATSRAKNELAANVVHPCSWSSRFDPDDTCCNGAHQSTTVAAAAHSRPAGGTVGGTGQPQQDRHGPHQVVLPGDGGDQHARRGTHQDAEEG